MVLHLAWIIVAKRVERFERFEKRAIRYLFVKMKFSKILQSILLERYINLISKEDKTKYAKEVWNILQKAYASIGGFKSANTIEELINDTFMWKLVRKNGRIVAAVIYKDQRGRKSIAGAAELGPDGKATEEGKAALISIVIEDIKMNRSWSEVSGKMEHLKLKHGATPIPNTYAAELTGKEILELKPDGYHYVRMIGGKPYEKMIVGYVEGLDLKALRK